MSNKEDSNYISLGSWMWMMFVTAIPVVGVIMVFVWAFTGENESRKNYYRAILVWVLVLIALMVGLIVAGGLLGNWPALQKIIQNATRKS